MSEQLASQIKTVTSGAEKYSELPFSSSTVEHADIEYVRGQLQLHIRVPKNKIDLEASQFKDEEFESPTTLPNAVDDEKLVESLASGLANPLDISKDKVISYLENDMECTASASDMYVFTLFFS